MKPHVPVETPPQVDLALKPSPSQKTVIRVEQATVRRGNRMIWRNVSLDVRAGEFIAILGPNGAGKSTLLRAILGLIPLSQGRITVLGESPHEGKSHVGYVPQRRSFDADVHVRGRDLVMLGTSGTRWGVPVPGLARLLGPRSRAAQERNRVQEVIELVGATAYADRPIGELSGGEQQRLLIAQALVTRPDILLLDEPLDSLDLHNQQEVSAVIRRVSQECGAAVLLVAHDINPILPYLDRVCYVAAGRTAIGRPEEVITTDTLSMLYDAPVDVLCTRDGRLVVVGAPEGVSHHAPHGHEMS